MFVGSLVKKQGADERARVETYFKDLDTPVNASLANPAAVATGSDLKVMGVTTLLFGGLMSITGFLILLSSGSSFSISINLATGGAFLLFGILIYVRGRTTILNKDAHAV